METGNDGITGSQKVQLIEESMKPDFKLKAAAIKYGISESSVKKILENFEEMPVNKSVGHIKDAQGNDVWRCPDCGKVESRVKFSKVKMILYGAFFNTSFLLYAKMDFHHKKRPKVSDLSAIWF